MSQKEKSGELKQNFGLRKLSVGLASVLLSSTMWSGNSEHAHAATANSNNMASENDSQDSGSVAMDSGIEVSTVSNSADSAETDKAQAADSAKQADAQASADSKADANVQEGQAAASASTDSDKNVNTEDTSGKSSVTLTKDNETGKTSVSVTKDNVSTTTLDIKSMTESSEDSVGSTGFVDNAKMSVSLLADTNASTVTALSDASEYSNYDHSTALADPETAKASYKKGENVPVSFAFANNTDTDQNITATMTVYYGARPVGLSRAVSEFLKSGEAYDIAKNADAQNQFTIDNSWLQNNSGYTVQIKVTDASGKQIGLKNIGLAIEDDWTVFPRYGVIAGSGDHASGIPNDPELLKKYYEQIEEMKNMHVNSYFFYDVYKEAANPFPDEDTYTQEWATWTSNKPQISTQAVKDLVAKVHDTNASAMLYNMIHARNTDSNQQNTPGLPDDSQLMYNANDGAFGSKGQPMSNGAAAQVYYNPASPSWQKYISEVMLDAMKRGNFDGWNGDTIGDNTVTTSEDRGTDKTFQVKDTYGAFSKSIMDAFKGKKSDGSDYYYTINNVNTEGLSDSLNNVSVAYTELWPSGWFDNNAITEYGDLKNVVDSVRDTSGKSLIVSAYLKNNTIGDDNTYNINAELLTTASIAAAGGYHMELDANASSNDQYGTGVLANEYYPNQDHKVSEDMNRLLYQYSQFQVQYENFLRGSGVTNDTALAKTYTADGTQVSRDENNSTSAGRNGNQVWTFTKKGDGFKTIQLINLMGINSDWDNTSGNNNKNPETQKDLSVTYPLGSMTESQAKDYADNVYIASPDDWDKGSMVKASAAVVNNGDGTYSLKISVPELALWDMVYIRDPKVDDTPINSDSASGSTSQDSKADDTTNNSDSASGSTSQDSKVDDTTHDSDSASTSTSNGKGENFADQNQDLLDRAGADGITVTKGESKSYGNQADAEKDIADQASSIKSTLDNSEAAKSSYDAAQASSEAAEKKSEDAQNTNDQQMVKGVSQGLTFKSEPTADVDINTKNNIKGYTPDPQKAKVTYADGTTGKTITVKNLSDKSNDHSSYTTAETPKAPEAELAPDPAQEVPAPQLPQTGNSEDVAALAAGTFAAGTSLFASVLKRRFKGKKQ